MSKLINSLTDKFASMIGFPKHLNSKADYLYIRENFSKDKWKPYY